MTTSPIIDVFTALAFEFNFITCTSNMFFIIGWNTFQKNDLITTVFFIINYTLSAILHLAITGIVADKY